MDDDTHHDEGAPLHRQLTTVTLTAKQFESLYLQPRDPRMEERYTRQFGNPTPFGLTCFILAHIPLTMDFLNFQGATAASSTTMLGVFYGVAGIGLYLSCIMEWVMGNTFPSCVFGTFGGFWISYGILLQPTMDIAASFAPASDGVNGAAATMAGAATRAYNSGVAMYFVVWSILGFIYFLAALRTNVPFAMVFLTFVCALDFIAAGYFHSGVGKFELATKEFKAGGAFAFCTGMFALYIDINLILGSVGFRWSNPLFDISHFNFFKARDKNSEKEHEA
ncbi:hypothetical protein SISNIDRAFT_415516 [Sistotremastrum niveocremeum HHB9708]|uniref:FUN34 transmembrane protein n=1 Tax=Sistotremastrum niveocremeum HHB9708 TaxID=1314777 RepID=A0A164RA94_9AGAM|nr:hypothetical protein SISNIDRAFT_415516 [Sistotremastrum niveocremeum HHB9708]